jgi:sulfoxide reductase heme-binding subunit YedZ
MSSAVLWYLTRASGLVALVLLTATTVLGIVTANRVITPRWPGFALQDLHRRISGVAVTFLGLHVLTSILDTYVHIGWAAAVVPFVSSYQPLWVALGTVGLDLLVAVGVTSLLRARIGARAWRAVHWLAYLSWPVAIGHAFGMGTDMGTPWVAALGAACAAAVVGAASWRVTVAGAARRRAAQLGASGRRPPGVPAKRLAA